MAFLAILADFRCFSGFSGSPGRGFTSTPRAGAPVTPFWRFWGSGPGEARGGPFWGLFGENPQKWGFWGSWPRGSGGPLPGPGSTPPQEEGMGVEPQPVICTGGGGDRRGSPPAARRVSSSGLCVCQGFVRTSWFMPRLPKVGLEPSIRPASATAGRGQPGLRYAPAPGRAPDAPLGLPPRLRSVAPDPGGGPLRDPRGGTAGPRREGLM